MGVRSASNPNLVGVIGSTLFIRRDGTNSPTADIDWDGFQIINLLGLDPEVAGTSEMGTAALDWLRLFTRFIRPGTGQPLVFEDEAGVDRVTIDAAGSLIANAAATFDIQIAATSVLIADSSGVRLNRNVEANTAGSGAPNVLTAAERFKILTNEGSGAQNFHTLPAAAAGLEFSFVVQDPDGIRITAAAADTIRLGGTVSIAAGFVESLIVGSAITLECINATEWVALGFPGTWEVETS